MQQPVIAYPEIEEAAEHIYNFEDFQFQASQDQDVCTRLANLLVEVCPVLARQVSMSNFI